MAQEPHIIEQNITHTLEVNYMPYAMSVIVSRAIPEIDGFKPAHRKLLYTMYKMGLLNGGRIKSADVVGQTMRLNPHGDGAIYETLVRLTRGNDALLHPFVDSKGNFGKHYSRDMAYAASRYTEVKLDGLCQELFANIDKDTVDFIDNYNGTMKEPVLFPTTFPNMLVTANQGIAVGMASAIASFNLAEVCHATIAYIKDNKTDLLKHMPAPDFSTGGELLYDEKEMAAIYETGRGSFKLRAKYRFDKKNSCIEVVEIPYTTTVEVIIDKIVALVKAGKIKDINDVRDETDLNGLKIAIDIKKAADPDLLMHKLFSMTTLSDSFSCNFNVLIEGKPMVLGVAPLLDAWLSFRRDCIRRQSRYDMGKKAEKLHLLQGLSGILLDIDKAIAIIRNTEEDSQVIPNLMEAFHIDQLQAEFIAEIKLRNLNKAYLLNRMSELDSLKADIEALEALVGSDKKIDALICTQLKEVAKKYGTPRRTILVPKEETPVLATEDFIEDYGVKLFLTEHSYFKKIPLTSLRSAGEQFLKDDDVIVQEIETTNKADVLFFSDRYNAYKAKIHELPSCKASAIGEFLTNLLSLEDGEKIVAMCATTDYSGFMLFAFDNGKMAKIDMAAYATKVNRKKLVNAYSDKAPLVFAGHFAGDCDLFARRNTDKAVLFNTSLIGIKTTKNAAGVQVLTLKKNSTLSAVMPYDAFPAEDKEYYRTNKIPSTGHFIVKAYEITL